MKAFKIGAALAALLIVAPAAATPFTSQQRRQPGSIHGHVLQPDGRPVTMPIKISLKQMRGERNIAYTDSSGSFQMTDLDPGLYTVEAESDRDRKYDPASERVEVFPNTPALITIFLKEKGKVLKEKPASDTVSAAELDQNIPPGAAKEFERGTKASREGKVDEAIEHMRKAISAYPSYLQAMNDLGTFLLAQGKLEEAADELSAAVSIAPKAFNPRLNLGIVLVRQHEFAGAAQNLEVALSLDPNSPAAHLYAGLACMGLGEAERAEKELTSAYELGGSNYALAQLHLGQLYMDRGDRERARKAFETYLRDKPDAADAEQVRRMIAILR